MTFTPISLLVTGGAGFIGANFIRSFIGNYREYYQNQYGGGAA